MEPVEAKRLRKNLLHLYFKVNKSASAPHPHDVDVFVAKQKVEETLPENKSPT